MGDMDDTKRLAREAARRRKAGESWQAIAAALGESAEFLEMLPMLLGSIWDELLEASGGVSPPSLCL